MARTTTNYGFNISEGSDLVNPLTDIFPNFESLDGDLKEVSNATFGVATELKTGTVHALTRDDQDKTVFKFTATANFTAGDTFTLDGAQVSALTTAGEQLTTGCYIIGSEVIVAVKGTLLTFFISNVVTDASTLEGHSASYFATASDLSDTDADVLAVSNKVGSAVLTTTAQDCSGAINELDADLSALTLPTINVGVEEVIGTLNGENVYRKRYMADNVTITTDTQLDATINYSTIAQVLSVTGSIKCTSGSSTFIFTNPFPYTGSNRVYTDINNSALRLMVAGYTIKGYFVEIVYTKAS